MSHLRCSTKTFLASVICVTLPGLTEAQEPTPSGRADQTAVEGSGKPEKSLTSATTEQVVVTGTRPGDRERKYSGR
jgi:hypothetical protein